MFKGIWKTATCKLKYGTWIICVEFEINDREMEIITQSAFCFSTPHMSLFPHSIASHDDGVARATRKQWVCTMPMENTYSN